MKKNLIIKLLSSLPIILLVLYFIPFLGICLLILRAFVYGNKKKSTAIFLIAASLIILLPKLLNLINVKNTVIPYLSELVNSDIYKTNLIGFSKLLLTIGILYFVISTISTLLFSKSVSAVKNYINESEKKQEEISKKNDLIMKEKRERALNTRVVKCPYCGADNMFTENTGTCKFCRRNIS